MKRGDVLIKGVSYEGAVVDSIMINPPQQKIRAKGIIKARVWYEGYGESELVTTVHERTGRQEIGVALRVGQQEFQLKKVSSKNQGDWWK